MKFRHHIVRALDGPIGRTALARTATLWAKALGQGDVEIYFRDGWWHRVGLMHFPTGPRFTYGRWSLSRLANFEREMRARSAGYWFCHGTPRPGSVILDIGAGTGEDVLAFSDAVGPQGRVVAIEAHPQSFALLSQMCRMNGLDNVALIHAPVMDKSGTVTISDSGDLLANSVTQRGELKVPAVTLDTLCAEQGVGAIDLVKMNIEGAELVALSGAGEMLRRCRAICAAAHDFRADRGDGEAFRTSEFVSELLASQGFRIERRVADPRPWVRDHIWGLRGRD